MPGARWFPEAKLNFAENLLRRQDPSPAIIFRGEDRVIRRLTHAELYAQVSKLAQALRASGVEQGDRVAGILPNMPEAIIAALAAASIGATWSSCSPDFGTQSVLDRFGQIRPKVLFAADGYFYNGNTHDSLTRIAEIVSALPSVEQTVIVPYTREDPAFAASLSQATGWGEFVEPFMARPIRYTYLPFDHPLYIMYSSGTTGTPKCIVHGAGGTLLQHVKEHLLHVDLKRDDRFFYFTTCGWMMWNWLVSGLASGATLLLYDGSPFHPHGNALFDYADAEGMAVFGTSAKYIDAVQKAGLVPRRSHKLNKLKAILSTGSPLAPESFDFVYQNIKTDVCLASISGGTDIVSCFALANPILPVWRGELQCRGLGLKVDVFDDDGHPVPGKKGELVCTAPFPCMPIGFWNDLDGAKYRAAYFERFPGVWCHGDYVELTEHDGLIIHGRSDAVLNPGGVRIGTAEIYRQVEQFDEVLESIVIGQEWAGDVRVVLFVKLRDGYALNENLVARIKQQIKANTSPRHVPAKVVQVADIPRTRSGKIVELAVRDVVHGRPIKNTGALANPEALEHFKERPELKT
jgi:acetoacetyl-CoA synthetase